MVTRAALPLAAAALALALVAEAALPPAYGGVVRLPLLGPLLAPDPRAARTPFEASLGAATFDTLYELDLAGRVQPALARALPRAVDGWLEVDLRPASWHHGERVQSDAVLRALRDADTDPRTGWLLAAFAHDAGGLVGEAPADDVLRLKGPEALAAARILAAAPLALAFRRAGRPPSGTGSFTAERTATELRLRGYRHAWRGAPYLRQIHLVAAPSRAEALRAYELGSVDACWFGASLYGGTPARPSTARALAPTALTLLLPNPRVTESAGWLGLIGPEARARLARAGIGPGPVADRSPPPRPPAAPPRHRALRLLARVDDPLERKAAETLAGALDDRGVAVELVLEAAARIPSALGEEAWDLRIESVQPPLPGLTASVAAALAAAGQEAEARALAALAFEGEGAAAEGLARLRGVVLGHRQETLFHRTELRGLSADGLGRLRLEALFLPRRRP